MIYENQKPKPGCLATLLMVGLMVCLAGQALGQGIFALQPGSHDPRKLDPPRGNRLVYAADLNTPGIDGLTVRGRRFDASGKPWPLFDFYDQCQATVKKAGDRWTLLLMSGDSPNFTSEAYLREWETLIAQLGVRYGNDPSLYAVSLSGASPYGVSEERHHKITPAIEAADKRLMRAWANAFPTKKLLFAIGNKDDAGMKRLILYAKSIAPGRVIVKNNAMKSGTNLKANHNKLIVWAGQQGLDIGFEMVGSDNNWPKVKSNIAAIERQAGRKISYLAAYPGNLVQAGAK